MAGPARDAPPTAPVDVLVLGAGLAGLRAGIAALEQGGDGLRVHCLCLSQKPSGSSFANFNNALGMQVLASDEERDAYLHRACEIAAPGAIERNLAAFMAEQSMPRLLELREWGLPLPEKTADLLALRKPGCFLQERATALLFNDLDRLRRVLAQRFLARGGHLEGGVEVVSLCCASGEPDAPVRGALLRREGAQAYLAPARCVVLALGGPAALYEHTICGPAVPGVSYALLQRAGARVKQAGLLQFLWHRLEPRTFISPHVLANQRWQVRDPTTGEACEIPESLLPLARSRASHCPIAYNFQDAALDRFLLDMACPDGATLLRPHHARGEEPPPWQRAAPMAQSGNGGALIDKDGRTGVPGLFACGESATGMHGGNRIGGGMVLATQVFGKTAGEAAARDATEWGDPPLKHLAPCGEESFSAVTPREGASGTALRARVGRLLQRNAIAGKASPELPQALAQLQELGATAIDPGERLVGESAAIVARHLLERPEHSREGSHAG